MELQTFGLDIMRKKRAFKKFGIILVFELQQGVQTIYFFFFFEIFLHWISTKKSQSKN